MAEIPVSGEVLSWARNFRGLSLDDAAGLIGISSTELEEFETEVRKPTLTKFEKLAAVYKLPLATLFRRTPPPEPKKLTDFRTVEGVTPRKSFEFEIAMSNVRTLQATLRILRAEDDMFRRAALREYSLDRDPFQQ